MAKSILTIRDIALQCHVSTATVSRALNGKPGVSPSLRTTIQDCARASGYAPNPNARSMRALDAAIRCSSSCATGRTVYRRSNFPATTFPTPYRTPRSRFVPSPVVWI
ncbi:MAG: LacI family DNA-binding transcriptional regulator [Bifidobacterium mongoliense]